MLQHYWNSPSDCLVSYAGHSLWGEGCLIPLQRCSRCILQPHLTGQLLIFKESNLFFSCWTLLNKESLFWNEHFISCSRWYLYYHINSSLACVTYILYFGLMGSLISIELICHINLFLYWLPSFLVDKDTTLKWCFQVSVEEIYVWHTVQ